ncbi:hypothetical protein [Rubellicoccus peritrichatus]|uniref:PEP-CTERM protein-sorting domain-containing protein n=1 Tax=Rubellicoccus peritrichatus TaxID=3080537 RepID=A0AAQ3LCE8_9BACT|nr:hypothetical protein [Puniceicoccus sp. CR14]WOO43236.1 hypothetical protein RZN69_09055 [Puniceicoccus sp. CR14]
MKSKLLLFTSITLWTLFATLQSHAIITIVPSATQGTIATSQWSPSNPFLGTGHPTPIITLTGYVSFDLSGFTTEELNNATFALNYTVTEFSSNPEPFTVEYIGTFADDSMPGATTTNLALWQGTAAINTGATVSSPGVYANQSIVLSDNTFSGGDFAIIRFATAAGPSDGQYRIDHTAVTLAINTVPEPGTYALIASVFGLAFVMMKRYRKS